MSNTQGIDYTLLFWKRSNLENNPLPGSHQREPTLSVCDEVRLSVYLLGPNDNPEPPLNVHPLEHLIKLSPRSPPAPGVAWWFRSCGNPLHF